MPKANEILAVVLRQNSVVLFGYFINLLGLITLGSFLVSRGDITFAAVMISIPLSGQVLQMVQGFGSLWSFLCERETSIDRIFDVLDTKQEKLENKAPSNAPEAKLKDIKFEHVTFGYTADMPVLKNVCFEIKGGQSVAFVGESGSGKSTIFRLLMGFYNAESGTIKVGESTAEEKGLTAWRRQFSYVQQEASLFNVSLRRNLALGADADLDDSALQAAAITADADEFISAFSDGYEHSAGENGGNLSGGERQRVVIARGLLANAPMILFDESTSALDSRTEEAVRQAMVKLHGERTLVMILHRLEFSAGCDVIYFMDKGRIAEFGTHDELLAKKGGYAKMWSTQIN